MNPLCASLMACLGSALCAQAATFSWTNPNGGSWSTPANWSPNGVPASGDTALITLAGSYVVTLSANATVANLTLGVSSGNAVLALNGQNLNATSLGRVQARGSLVLTNGVLQGQWEIGAGGNLQLGDPGSSTTVNLQDCTLVNNGNVSWLNGTLGLGGYPTQITNYGSFEIHSDNSMVQTYGAVPVFANFGTIRKTDGSGATTISSLTLDQQGDLQISKGTINLGGGSGFRVIGGSYDLAAGTQLLLSSGTSIEAGGTFSGQGSARLQGGTLILMRDQLDWLSLEGGTVQTGPGFQQSGAITNLIINGATLDGTNRVGNGLLSIAQGSLSGLLTVQNGGTMELGAKGSVNFQNATVLNQGTVRWLANTLGMGGYTTTLTNQGLLEFRADASLSQTYGNVSVIANLGTIRKSQGTGATTLSGVTIDQRGALEVVQGSINIGGGSGIRVLGGSYNLAAGSELNFTSGTCVEAGGTFTGQGQARLQGGTLSLVRDRLPWLSLEGGTVLTEPSFQAGGAITNLILNGATLGGTNRIGNGLVAILKGVISGSLEIEAPGTLELGAGGVVNLQDATIVNLGAIRWLGNALGLGGYTTVITNKGLFEILADASMYQTYGYTPVLANSGLIRKTEGPGTTSISGLNLDQRGSFQITKGSVNIGGGNGTRTISGTYDLAAGTELNFTSGASILDQPVYTGEGMVRFSGGDLTLTRDTVPWLSLDSGTVRIGPEFQSAGAITNLVINGATLAGTNRVGQGNLKVKKGVISGVLTVEVGGVLDLGENGPVNLQDATLVNHGSVRWLGNNLGLGGYTTVVTNFGLFEIRTDTTLAQTYGYTPVFANYGTLRKTQGVAATSISGVLLDQQGTLELSKGNLNIAAGGSLCVVGGLYDLAPGTELNFSSGTFLEAGGLMVGQGIARLQGATLRLVNDQLPWLHLETGTVQIESTFQSSGAITNLLINGATLSGTNRVQNGTLTIAKGALSGSLTVSPNAVLDLGSNGPVNLQDALLINHGTTRWLGNNLGLGGYTTIVTNDGLFEIWTDAVMSHTYGNPPVFVNQGLLLKAAGNGVTTISLPSLNNESEIEADTGTLRLPRYFTNTVGTLRVSGGELDSQDVLQITGGVLEGTGSIGRVQISGGVVSPGGIVPGSLRFNQGLVLAPEVTVKMQVQGTTSGTGYDQLVVQGTADLNGAKLDVAQVPVLPNGTGLMLVDNDGTDTTSRTFGGMPEGFLYTINNQLFRVRYATGTGNDVSLIRDGGGANLFTFTSRTNLSGLTNFEFRGWGTNYGSYFIYASTNLVDWDYLGTVTADGGGAFRFVDYDRTNYPARFYRSLGP